MEKQRPLFVRMALMSMVVLAAFFVAIGVLNNVIEHRMPSVAPFLYKVLMFVFTWVVVTASLRSLRRLDKRARWWEKFLLAVLIGFGSGVLTWLFSAVFLLWGSSDSLLVFSFTWREALFFTGLAVLAAVFVR